MHPPYEQKAAQPCTFRKARRLNFNYPFPSSSGSTSRIVASRASRFTVEMTSLPFTKNTCQVPFIKQEHGPEA